MKSNIEIIGEKKYQWSPNWSNPIAHTPINVVISELESIQESFGEVSPETLIESSKNKKSILHVFFQWDNEKAAHLWRLRQARDLLTRIQVTIIKDGEPRTMQVYETIERKFFEGTSKYKKFDAPSGDSIDFIKKRAINDLVRVKTKLYAHNIEDPIKYILMAILHLQSGEPEDAVVVSKDDTPPVLLDT